eukprot:scaffold5855_cov117-Isochrysis_galbana.AAC.13
MRSEVSCERPAPLAASTALPAKTAPAALASSPTAWSCASAACSTARKGPTSPPAGDSTPITPATTRRRKEPDDE